MTTPHLISNSDPGNPGFRLFDEIFRDLITISKSIEIRYKVQFNSQTFEFSNEVSITSLNGFNSPEEFRVQLTALLESSFDNLFLSLQQSSSKTWSQQIGIIQYRLRSLAEIISDEQILIPDRYGTFSIKRIFKSFTQAKLVSEEQFDFIMAGQWIRYQSRKFAEVWLEVTDDAVRRCGLIHEILQNTLKTVSNSVENENSDSNYSRLKFNLSVPQLAYLFRLLIHANIIDLPSRNVTRLINWMVRHFQSKSQASIQKKSLRNKFTTPDLAALDYWEQILKTWISHIHDERDRLTK